MAIYVFNETLGAMVDKATGERMVPIDAPLATPQVFGDTPDYQSPIDGRLVSGRRARRYDMESNNCVDANDLDQPKGLTNERFMKKKGLEHLARN